MARPRKPDAQKVAQGNPGKRKIADASEQIAPLDSLPTVEPPSWLTHELALKVWDALAPELTASRFLKPAFSYAFARYCVLMARWIKWHDVLLDSDPIYETDSAHGKMKRIEPLAALDSKVVKELLALEAHFGLTPLARQSLQTKLAGAGLPLGGGSGEKPKTVEGRLGETQAPTHQSPLGILN